jgi:hypothetical protein
MEHHEGILKDTGGRFTCLRQGPERPKRPSTLSYGSLSLGNALTLAEWRYP